MWAEWSKQRKEQLLSFAVHFLYILESHACSQRRDNLVFHSNSDCHPLHVSPVQNSISKLRTRCARRVSSKQYRRKKRLSKRKKVICTVTPLKSTRGIRACFIDVMQQNKRFEGHFCVVLPTQIKALYTSKQANRATSERASERGLRLFDSLLSGVNVFDWSMISTSNKIIEKKPSCH